MGVAFRGSGAGGLLKARALRAALLSMMEMLEMPTCRDQYKVESIDGDER